MPSPGKANEKRRKKPMIPAAISRAVVRGSDAEFPPSIACFLGDSAPEALHAIGNPAILRNKIIALFCSAKCPGSLILQTFDLVPQLRDAGVVVIGGFQSPMENECLTLLLRGRQPVVWCQAKRLPADRFLRKYAQPISDGRLLLLSPFGEQLKRITKETAQVRNELVAALADKIFICYADGGGMIEKVCFRALKWNKYLMTFNSPYNVDLLSKGAHPYIGPASITELIALSP